MGLKSDVAIDCPCSLEGFSCTLKGGGLCSYNSSWCGFLAHSVKQIAVTSVNWAPSIYNILWLKEKWRRWLQLMRESGRWRVVLTLLFVHFQDPWQWRHESNWWIWMGEWESATKVVSLNVTLEEGQSKTERHFSVFAVWVVWWGWTWVCGWCCEESWGWHGSIMASFICSQLWADRAVLRRVAWSSLSLKQIVLFFSFLNF